MSTLTTNYSFIKPAVFSDVDLWGGYLNTSLDSIDTQIKTTDNFAQAALPKAGGTMSGNITMGTFKLSGLGVGTAATDSTTFGQNQSNIAGHAFSTGGTVDALTAVMSPATTAYSTHFFYRVTSIGPNTIVAPTINIDGLGVKTIKKGANANLAVGDTGAAGYEMLLGYNGTNVILLNPPSSASGATLASNTFTGDQTVAALVGGNYISSNTTNPGVAAQNNGGWIAQALSSTGVSRTFASITSVITSAVNAAEAGYTSIKSIGAGALVEALRIGLGIYTPTATGGDPGAGFINVSGGYKVNNVPLALGTTVNVIYKATQDSRTTITLTNDTDFTFAMAANTNYLIEGVYYFNIAAATCGVKIGVSGPASPTAVMLEIVPCGNSTWTPLTNVATGASAAVGLPSTTASGDNSVKFSITYKNGTTAGTFTMQTAQNTALSTSLYKVSSWMKYQIF